MKTLLCLFALGSAPLSQSLQYLGETAPYTNRAVVVDGNTLAFGSLTSGSFALRVFERRAPRTWEEVLVNEPTPRGHDSAYAYDLDLEGDVIVAGAPLEVTGAGRTGRVHVLRRNPLEHDDWLPSESLDAPVPAPGERFGEAVVLSGSWLAVGAPGSTESTGSGDALGRVDLYYDDPLLPGGFAFSHSIEPPAGADARLFGSELAFDGLTLAVGGLEAQPRLVGRADVFEPTGTVFAPRASLTSPTGAWSFGRCLSLLGDRLAVGEPRDGLLAGATGLVRIYERNAGGAGAWGLAATVRPKDGQPGDAFGWRVQLEPDRLWVGAPQAETGDGVVYRFDLFEDRWRQTSRAPYQGTATSFPRFGHGTHFGASGRDLFVGPGGYSGLEHFLDLHRHAHMPPPAPTPQDVARRHSATTLRTGVPVPGFEQRIVDPLYPHAGSEYWTITQFGAALDAAQDVLVAESSTPQSWSGFLTSPAPYDLVTFRRRDGAWAQTARLPVPQAPLVVASSIANPIDLAEDAQTLAVGAPYLDVPGSEVDGEVLVYRRDDASPEGWDLEAQLLHPHSVSAIGFGEKVVVDGTTLLVVSDALYLYERDPGGTWVLVQELPRLGQSADDDIALEGDILAMSSNTVPGTPGSLLVIHERIGGVWTRVGLFEGVSDANRLPELSLHGERIAWIPAASGARPIEVVERIEGTWSRAAVIDPPTGMDHGLVSIRGHRIVASNPDSSASEKVLVYDRDLALPNAWTLTSTLEIPEVRRGLCTVLRQTDERILFSFRDAKELFEYRGQIHSFR